MPRLRMTDDDLEDLETSEPEPHPPVEEDAELPLDQLIRRRRWRQREDHHDPVDRAQDTAYREDR